MLNQTTATGKTQLQPFYVNIRVKLSALWAAMLFVFAYVDIFSLYRSDVRAEIEAGQISGFQIGEAFLFATTVYVLIPSLMVFGALVLRPGINRVVNITLSTAYALTIVAGAIGEWNYWILGSVVETGLLAAIVYYAWTWPRLAPSTTLDAGTELTGYGTPHNALETMR